MPDGPTLNSSNGPAKVGRVGRSAPGLMGWLRWRITWSRQTALFGVSLSLFVHVGLLLVLALIYPKRAVVGTGVGHFDFPLAVIAEAELTELVRVALDDQAPSLDQSSESSSLPSIDDITPAVGSDALMSLEATDLSTLSGAGGAGDGDFGGDGLDGGDGGAGGGGAQFFGVEARGSRFAYIVDVSGSMEGDRLSALKRALLASIGGLYEQAHFTVVLFSSDAVALTGNRWVPATERAKKEIEKDIRAMRAFGGTNPLPAFEIVFAMRPRPDAIYFMTDGQFADGEEDKALARIARLNDRGDRRTPIHCITFIERSSERLMRQIARQSGGTYTHVEGIQP